MTEQPITEFALIRAKTGIRPIAAVHS